MTSTLTYALPFLVLFFLLAGLASWLLILNRMQRRLWRKRRRNPTSAELRRKRIPVIESTPFWVPWKAGDVIGVEIQPSPRLMMPFKFSTPKALRNKANQDESLPKLKFSVQYHKASGVLEVQLLEAENISPRNLEDDLYQGDSSVFVFSDVQLAQQEMTKQRLRLMSRRRRRRTKSFEIEMSYDELQLQTLQFCVMGYDEYSRQKVIGDVLLPLAELAQQGVDITKELVMWRDIQTGQPGSSALCERMSSLSTIQALSRENGQPRATGQPPDRSCTPS